MVLLQELPDDYHPSGLFETSVFHLFVFCCQEASEALCEKNGFQERECEFEFGIKLMVELSQQMTAMQNSTRCRLVVDQLQRIRSVIS